MATGLNKQSFSSARLPCETTIPAACDSSVNVGTAATTYDFDDPPHEIRAVANETVANNNPDLINFDIESI